MPPPFRFDRKTILLPSCEKLGVVLPLPSKVKRTGGPPEICLTYRSWWPSRSASEEYATRSPEAEIAGSFERPVSAVTRASFQTGEGDGVIWNSSPTLRQTRHAPAQASLSVKRACGDGRRGTPAAGPGMPQSGGEGRPPRAPINR